MPYDRALFSGAAVAVLVAGAAMMPAQAAGPLEGQTIRMIVIGDPVFKAMQQIHGELQTMSGATIELNVLPFDTLHQQVLLNSQNKESRYDIIAIDLPQFGEYQGFLVDLTPWAGNMDHSDFQAAAWNGVVHGGKILAMPLQPQSEIFGYRTDLFQAAGITSPPKTVDDVLADAKKLHHPEKNVAGICWNAARGTPLGQTFLQTLGAFGQAPIALTKEGDDYDIGTIKPENMHPTIDNKAGIAVAHYLQALMPYLSAGHPGYGVGRAHARVRTGRLCDDLCLVRECLGVGQRSKIAGLRPCRLCPAPVGPRRA